MTTSHSALSRSQFRVENLKQWKQAIGQIIPSATVTSHEWKDLSSIVEVLRKLRREQPICHVLLPEGGGLDFRNVDYSWEHGCLELDLSGIYHVAKATRLALETFGDDSEWDYFRLETMGLGPSGVYREGEPGGYYDSHGAVEEVTQIEPGHYESIDVWTRGYYGLDEDGDEKPLSADAKRVRRHMRGAFVFVAKTGFYNMMPDTYDARHNLMTSSQFRTYVEDMKREVQLLRTQRARGSAQLE